MGKKRYVLMEKIAYCSPRYNRWVIVPEGRKSDGATGAKDLRGDIYAEKNGAPYGSSKSWWVHDELCLVGCWSDGTLCTNWQASFVLYDILKEEGHWIRASLWFVMTFAFGGGKARDNGMFNLKRKGVK